MTQKTHFLWLCLLSTRILSYRQNKIKLCKWESNPFDAYKIIIFRTFFHTLYFWPKNTLKLAPWFFVPGLKHKYYRIQDQLWAHGLDGKKIGGKLWPYGPSEKKKKVTLRDNLSILQPVSHIWNWVYLCLSYCNMYDT